jgi:hypothetical protein
VQPQEHHHPLHQHQQQRGLSSSSAAAAAAAAADSASDASSSGGGPGASPAPPASWEAFFERRGRRKARPGAWRERMPGRGEEGGRYGVVLRERDPALFERMRLVLGYYDQPENTHLPRPAAPSTAHVNNLQTLFFTRDIDPYYKWVPCQCLLPQFDGRAAVGCPAQKRARACKAHSCPKAEASPPADAVAPFCASMPLADASFCKQRKYGG